jgi:uncharacterized membrane protein
MRAMLPLLLLAYPLVSHFGITSGHPDASYLWLGVILASAGAGRASSGPFSWRFAAGLALIAACIGFADQLAALPAKLLPVAGYVGLALFFGHSLLPGKTPLITRVMRRLRQEAPPSVFMYCRRLTAFWTVLLFLLAAQSLSLGLYAPAPMWSIFTNFVNPALIVFAFILEYPIRRRMLKDVSHKDFFGFVRDIIRTGLSGSDPVNHARR